jgi:predicted nucleic acid-binding protein
LIAIDSSLLLLFLSPLARPPQDPTTGEPIPQAHERVQQLIKKLDASKTKILIPTPVLSECLVHAGAALEGYLAVLQGQAVFRIAPFESKAAIELALMVRKAIGNGDKRGGINAPWAKLKFDRQIVAIAKVEGVSALYSDDPDIKHLGAACDIEVRGIADCPLPDDELSTPTRAELLAKDAEQHPRLL